MKFAYILSVSVVFAACSANGDENAANEANLATGQAEDVPIQGGESVPPPGAPANDQSPAPPGSEEPQGDISLAAAPARTEAGATVTLTLTNGTDNAIGYNLCTSALQTAAGTAVATDRVCTMELRTLQPGRNASYGYELPASLPDGGYRFSTSIDHMSGSGPGSVRSNAIEVR